MKKLFFILIALFPFLINAQSGTLTSTEATNNIVDLQPINMRQRTAPNTPIVSLKAKKLTLDTLIKVVKNQVVGTQSTINSKASKGYVDTLSATKVNTSTYTSGLALKADKTYTDTQLALKANLTDLNARATNTALAEKANITDVNALLNFKANNTDLYGKMQTLSSIADLQAYQNSNFAHFDGSTWEKKAGNVTSNGGSYAGTLVRVSSTAYWERRADYVTPEMFGANPKDGVSEGSTIQNALDFANANGLKVVFGKGDYIYTNTLEVGNIEVCGNPYFTVLKPTGCNGFKVLTNTGGGNSTYIHDLTIQQSGTALGTIGLDLRATTNSIDKIYGLNVERVNIYYFDTGIYARTIWKSNINTVKTVSCYNGLLISGQSVSNYITDFNYDAADNIKTPTSSSFTSKKRGISFNRTI
jgi:hypothetical protein